MNILLTERPTTNAYIESLIGAYQRAGQTVVCDASNFHFSNFVPDVLHVHWPERVSYWHAPLHGLTPGQQRQVIEDRLNWYRSRGTTIVHTVHNLVPHGAGHSGAPDAVFATVMNLADVIVHHCQASVRLTTEMYPVAAGKQHVVCPHGDYLLQHEEVDRSAARRRLGIPEQAFVVLNFGRQKPYKNEPFMRRVFDRLPWPEKYLLVAGKFEYPARASLKALALRVRNVLRERVPMGRRKFLYRDISNADLPRVIAAADVFFLGQSRALNSGQLALAATFRRPVVHPRSGCFEEAMTDWVAESYAPDDLEAAVAAVKRLRQRLVANGNLDNSAWLKRNSWDGHVAGLLQAIAALRG